MPDLTPERRASLRDEAERALPHGPCIVPATDVIALLNAADRLDKLKSTVMAIASGRLQVMTVNGVDYELRRIPIEGGIFA